MAVEYIGGNAPDGMSFGLSTTEKISFYGVTPIVQRSGAAQTAVSTTASVDTTDGAVAGYATTTQADAVVTLLNECRATLVAYGLMKGSA